MNKYQEALKELEELVHSELDGTKLLTKHLKYINTLQELVDKEIPKKFDGEYYHKTANTIMFNSGVEYNAIQKLGKLEDLEEQLGCPLEVMFKALEEGILLSNNNLYKCRLFYYTKEQRWTLICYEEGKSIVGVKLSDYQKTWWLKGEKPNE